MFAMIILFIASKIGKWEWLPSVIAKTIAIFTLLPFSVYSMYRAYEQATLGTTSDVWETIGMIEALFWLIALILFGPLVLGALMEKADEEYKRTK